MRKSSVIQSSMGQDCSVASDSVPVAVSNADPSTFPPSLSKTLEISVFELTTLFTSKNAITNN